MSLTFLLLYTRIPYKLYTPDALGKKLFREQGQTWVDISVRLLLSERALLSLAVCVSTKSNIQLRFEEEEIKKIFCVTLGLGSRGAFLIRLCPYK